MAEYGMAVAEYEEPARQLSKAKKAKALKKATAKAKKTCTKKYKKAAA